MTRPSDPLYGNQWHLAQLGNIESVWDNYTGKGVTVVVYDDGVEGTHEDLNDNYVPTGKFTYGGVTFGSAPLSSYDGHGTAVAGLIAAEANNGKGGVGVAWDAHIAALNFLEEVQYQSLATIRASLENARNFDVMNNSWGFSPLYLPGHSLANTTSVSWQISESFKLVAETGRGGLGTIVVNAAGNEGLNANGEGILASRHVMAVAASDKYGNVTSYSNWGANVLVTAPAANYTTDRSGNGGYNASGTMEITGPDPLADRNYTSVFGGTSAATPVVSGVVALMLQANPNLGWRDVHNILAMSASHTGSNVGSGPAGFEQDRWEVSNTGTWNGGGMAFNNSYGFGMVNALAAVSMAEVWTDMFGAAKTSANEVSASAIYTGTWTIPDYGTTYAKTTVVNDIEVETVMVTVNITHSWSSDLILTLIAPDLSEYTLMAGEGSSTLMDYGLNWTFAVEGARGLSSAGTWKLKIEDTYPGEAGVLTKFAVDIYGAPKMPYQVHTFTDDFLSYYQGNGRIVAATANDWLNFAAVTGNINIALEGLARIAVRGVVWASLDPVYEFTKVVLGSGNDTLIGSGSDDRIYGQRGGDRIDGLGGNDTLIGDSGNDRLDGGGGNDSLYGGAGNDIIYSGFGRDRVYLGTGNDVFFDDGEDSVGLIGVGSDTVFGESGNDTINGGGGRDVYYGGDGVDRIYGGLNNDTIKGDGLGDKLFGQNGNDVVYGGGGRDEVWLGNGDDIFYDELQNDLNGSDTVYAGSGDDTINGSGAGDFFYGDDGNDRIYGGLGNDVIEGGAQFDTIYAQNGNDTVTGGSGRDIAWLGFGNDVFYDDVQNDVFGNDTVYGGDGNDLIDGRGGADLFFGDGGADRIFGGFGNDTVYGGVGNDFIDGGADSDVIFGGTGNDTINGGDLNDTIHSEAGNDSVLGGNGSDHVWLGDGNDVFNDNVQSDPLGRDTVYGGAGNDTLNGGGGADYFDGGTGDDLISGGLGADQFVFMAGFGIDRVIDFADNIDTILLDDALWGGAILTASEIVWTYGQIVSGDAVLDFGNGNAITLSGFTQLGLLVDDVAIV